MNGRIGNRIAAAALAALALGGLLTTCAPGGDSSGGGYGAVVAQAVWPGDPGFHAARAGGGPHPLAAPAGVQSIVAVVSAADMSPVSATFDTTPLATGSGVINDVPAGSNRTLTLNGYSADNGTGSLIFQGTTTGISVSAGQTSNAGKVAMNSVAAGYLDTTFGGGQGFVVSPGQGMPARGIGITMDSSGRIIVAGYSQKNGSDIMTIWRYKADGTPDADFGTYVTHAGCGQPSRGNTVTIDVNGKILVAGYCTTGFPVTIQNAAIWRFNANGSPDTTFSNSPVIGQPYASHPGYGFPAEARAISVDIGGSQITIAGSSQGAGLYATIWQFYIDNWDTGFAPPNPFVNTNLPGGDAQANALAVDGSLRLVVAGRTTQAAIDSMVIYRYTTGSANVFDLFGANRYIASAGGGTNAVGNGMLINPAGNYVVTGQVRGSFPYMAVWRFLSTSTGSPDSTFGSNGYYWYQPAGDTRATQGNAIVRQSDGKLIVVGKRDNAQVSALQVWRLLNDGSGLDSTFNGGVLAVTNTGGSSFNFDEGLAVTLDSQGRVLVAGSTSDGASTTANPKMAVWRVLP